jgi:hypothetical protein
MLLLPRSEGYPRLKAHECSANKLLLHSRIALENAIVCTPAKMSRNSSDNDKSRGPPPSGLPPREKLPAKLQKIVDGADKEDNFYDELYDGTYVILRRAISSIAITPIHFLITRSQARLTAF